MDFTVVYYVMKPRPVNPPYQAEWDIKREKGIRGGLTITGLRMMEAAKLASRTGCMRESLIYIHQKYHPGSPDAVADSVARRMMKNQRWWQQVVIYMRWYMEDHGIDSKHIVDKVDKLVDILTDKLETARGATDSVALAKEIRELLNMYGGKWAGLDKTASDVTLRSTFELRPNKQITRLLKNAEDADFASEE